MNYIIAVLIALVPGIAFADVANPVGQSAWTFYAFGNGEVLWEILQSVSAMVNSEGYRSLATLLAISGMSVVAVMAGFDPGKAGQKFIGYVVVAFVTLYLLFKVTANVIITDPITGYTNVATGVPAVVGVPAAVISTIGQWLTEKTEQNFSLPDDLKVGKGGGFILASSLLGDAMKVNINDPYLRQTMAVYVSDCVMPAMANGEISTGDILTSGDLWNTIKTTNKGILTVHYSAANPSGTLVACDEAWTSITTALNSVSNDMLVGGMGAWGSTPVAIGAKLASASNYMTSNNIPLSGSALIKQTAVVNMFKESYKTAAAKTGNSELMMSMQIAQAEQSQKSSWFMAQELFKSMMGYIYSVLQAFIFAITPIVLVTLFIPGFGKAVLKNYGQILVWLVLWAPLMSIISFIVAAYGKQGLTAMAAAKGGFTMETIPVVSEMTNNMTLAGGFLMTMVPMIAWGLVKGAMAFTEFISAGVGSSFASSAASGAATDSLSLNNKSLDNFAANKFNSQQSHSLGSNGIDTKLNAGSALTKHELMRDGQVTSALGSDLMATKKTERAGGLSEQAVKNSTVTDQAAQQLNSNFSKQAALSLSNLQGLMSTATAGKSNGLSDQQAQQVAGAIRDTVTDMAAVAKIGSKQEDFKLSGEFGASLKGFGDVLKKDAKSLQNFQGMMKGNPAGQAIMAAMGLVKPQAGAKAISSKSDSLTTQGTEQDTRQNSKDKSTTWTHAQAEAYNQALSRADARINALNKSLTGAETTTVGEMATLQKAASDTIAYSQTATASSTESVSASMPVALTEEQARANLLAAQGAANKLPTGSPLEAAEGAIAAQKGAVNQQGEKIRADASNKITKDDQAILGALRNLNQDKLNKNAEVSAAFNDLESALRSGNAGSGADAGIAGVLTAIKAEGGKTDAESLKRIGDAIDKTSLGKVLAGVGMTGMAAADYVMNRLAGKDTPTAPSSGTTGGGKPAALPGPDGKGDTITMRQDKHGNWVEDTSRSGNAARTAGNVLRTGAKVLGGAALAYEVYDGVTGYSAAKDAGADHDTAMRKAAPLMAAVGEFIGEGVGKTLDVMNGRTPLETTSFMDKWRENQKPYEPGSPSSSQASQPAAAPSQGQPDAAQASAPVPSPAARAVAAGTQAINTDVGGGSLNNAEFGLASSNTDGYRLQTGATSDAWRNAFGETPPAYAVQAKANTAEQEQVAKIQADIGLAGGLRIDGINNGELTVTHTTGGALSNDERNQLVSAAQAAGVTVTSIREEGVTDTSPIVNDNLDIFSGESSNSGQPVTAHSLINAARRSEADAPVPEHIQQYPSSR